MKKYVSLMRNKNALVHIFFFLTNKKEKESIINYVGESSFVFYAEERERKREREGRREEKK